MKIGLVQYDPVWEDKEKNKEKLNSLLSGISGNEKLLILPEMTLTGFTMRAENFAEQLNGESFEYYSGIAGKYNAHVLGGVIESKDGKFFNSLLHINPAGELISVYRKIHPFSYSTEDKYYTRGTKTVTTQIDDLKTGLSICYDLRFPELYRYYGKERVGLIVVIANWPVTRIEHWRTLLKARAIENQCYVAGVNRIGKDKNLLYNGYSSVFDPMGIEIVTNTGDEKILTADISGEYAGEVQNKLPFLKDIFLL